MEDKLKIHVDYHLKPSLGYLGSRHASHTVYLNFSRKKICDSVDENGNLNFVSLINEELEKRNILHPIIENKPEIRRRLEEFLKD